MGREPPKVWTSKRLILTALDLSPKKYQISSRLNKEKLILYHDELKDLHALIGKALFGTGIQPDDKDLLLMAFAFICQGNKSTFSKDDVLDQLRRRFE